MSPRSRRIKLRTQTAHVNNHVTKRHRKPHDKLRTTLYLHLAGQDSDDDNNLGVFECFFLSKAVSLFTPQQSSNQANTQHTTQKKHTRYLEYIYMPAVGKTKNLLLIRKHDTRKVTAAAAAFVFARKKLQQQLERTCSQPAASCRGVRPPLPGMLTAAPRSSNKFTISRCPLAAARDSGVLADAHVKHDREK